MEIFLSLIELHHRLIPSSILETMIFIFTIFFITYYSIFRAGTAILLPMGMHETYVNVHLLIFFSVELDICVAMLYGFKIFQQLFGASEMPYCDKFWR